MVDIKIDNTKVLFQFTKEITHRDRAAVLQISRILFLPKFKYQALEKKQFELDVLYELNR